MTGTLDQLGRAAQMNLAAYFPDAPPGSRVEVLHDTDESGNGALVVRDGRTVYERLFKDGNLGTILVTADARQD